MKKYVKFILIFIVSFLFILNVNAVTANSPVYEDITYSECRNFQDSSIYTTASGYFGHCIKATCTTGTWKTEYYINNKMVVCTNGNQNKYTQKVKTGCSKYVNSCTPSAYPKYCTIIVYYDCNRTAAGNIFIPVTTTTKATTTTTTTTTKKPVTTTKIVTKGTTRPVIKSTTTTTPTIKSDNTYIESLIIEEVPSLLFNKNITDYTIQLEEDIKSLTIKVILEDNKSSYNIENNENINRNLPIKINVTAEDASTRIYTINIKEIEQTLDNNSKISSLNIEGYSIDFDPEVYSYTLTIKDESSLNISLTTESDKSTYSIKGNENLKNKSRIDILIKAEGGSESIYIINIKKKTNFTNVALILIVIFIFAFAGYNIYRKIRKSNEKPSSYEYE